MKTTEFKKLINKIEEVSTNGQFTKLENQVWNEQSFYTSKQWNEVRLLLMKVKTEKGLLSLSSHHSELKAGAEALANNRKVASMTQTEEKNVETVEETKPAVFTGEVEAVVDVKTEKIVYTAIDRVSKKLAVISNGYLAIVGDVARLYDLKAWEVTKHKNIYEMCEAKFDGMARGTVNNLLSIFKRFGDKETYKLTDEAKNEDGAPRSVRSLLEQIKSEKDALKAEKNGGAIEDEADGEASADKSKKPEVLANIAFDIIGGEWDVEGLVEELKKAIEKAEVDLSADCSVALTITR